MKRVFQLAGIIGIVVGLTLASLGSGIVGDPSIRTVHAYWVYAGAAIVLLGAALTFARGR